MNTMTKPVVARDLAVAPAGLARPIHALLLGMAILFAWMMVRAAGIYPVVFADEWSYSSYSRLLPLRDAGVPSYLYLALFRVTNVCGDGFLECARMINTAFIVLAVPLIYSVARRVCSGWPAVVVALFGAAGAFNTYAIYFMPEAMYFAGFWLLTWAALGIRVTSAVRRGFLLGAILGLLSLVKVHAIFLLPGVSCFGIYSEWQSGRKDWLRAGTASAVLTGATFALTKLGLGWLLAGPNGITLFGSLYGGMVGTVVHVRPLAELVLDAMGSLRGHVMALALMFGIPIATLLATRWTSRARGGAAVQSVAAYTVLLLLPLLAIVGYFTASVLGSGPYENLARLHMRYYNFGFPLLLIVAASQLASVRKFDLRAAAASAMVVLLAIYASWRLLPEFTPSMVDSPELRGLALDPALYLILGITGVAATAVWALHPRWGARIFLFALLPVMALAGNWHVGAEVRKRQSPDVYDEAGLFAKKYLDAGVARLVVVAPEPAALLRTLFHIDSAGAASMQLPLGSRVDFGSLPKNAEWLLLVGDYDLPSAAGSGLSLGKYRLIRTRQDYILDLRQASWPGIVSSARGLSTPEPWGTWSTGPEVQLEFVNELPQRFRLSLQGHAFGPNVGANFTAFVGQEKRTFRLDQTPRIVTVDFTLAARERSLRIAVPHPVSPRSEGVGDDSRELGLGLSDIRIQPLNPADSP